MYMTHKRRLLAGILLSAALLSGCTSKPPVPEGSGSAGARGLRTGGKQLRPGGLSAGRREQRRRKRSGGWVPGAGGIRERRGRAL